LCYGGNNDDDDVDDVDDVDEEWKDVVSYFAITLSHHPLSQHKQAHSN
jgi:hypothetical protein